MVNTISNDILQISVNSFGAELTSLKMVRDDLEFLWQGDSNYWAGQSTILFPFIGGLPGGGYTYNGKHYTMDSHGFARKSEFEISEQTESYLEYRLASSEESFKIFPWSFEFYVSYRLDKNSLTHGFKVVNKSDSTMLFSVGAHPGFNCPLYQKEKMEDYRLVFEKPEILTRRIKKDGLLSGEREPFIQGEDQKLIEHDLFYKDAVILDSLASDWLEIRNNRNSRIIRVEFEGFPYLGIWSARNNGPFICIEPWYGVDSTHGDSQQLTEKEGLQNLDPDGVFSCSYNIILE